VDFQPDVTVASVVERDGRFLMVEEHAGGTRVFNQPAGHLEDNESLLQAAIRETLEETAWQISLEHVIGIYLWQSPEGRRTFLRVAFAGRCRGHEGWRNLDDGIIRALWLNQDEIRGLGSRLRSPLVLRCLDDYVAGIRYPLSMLSHVDALKGAVRIGASA
jgi:8-oxo-dGTP pyrophosphatase MutT (NUDIX family)